MTHATARAMPTATTRPRARPASGRRVLRALAAPGIDAVLAVAARVAARRHPALFERLAAIPEPTFALVPDEIPLALILRADTRRPMLRAVARDDFDPARVAATIRGPLRLLARMADGRLDGDALFFSRQIAVEGSTEAAVALRNALDNAEFKGLAELVLPPGPAADFASRLMRLAGRILEKLHARRAGTEPWPSRRPS